MLKIVKAEIILRGMPYARVRTIDDALVVVEQMLTESVKGKT